MHSDRLTCNFCYNEYNQSDRIPRILPSCNHTLCSLCLEKLIDNRSQVQCPLCIGVCLAQKGINNLPINTKIMQWIKEKARLDFCSIHAEEIVAICIKDKTKICKRCIHSIPHKGHETKSLKDIKNLVKSQTENLEALRKDYQIHKTALNQMIDEERRGMQNFVREKFEEINQSLFKKEQALLEVIDLFFSKEQTEIEDSLIMQDINRRILDLSIEVINESFISALLDPLPDFALDTKDKAIKTLMQDFARNLEDTCKTFSISILSQIENYKSVFFERNISEKSQFKLYEETSQSTETTEMKVLFKLEEEVKRLHVFTAKNAFEGTYSLKDLPLKMDKLRGTKEICISFDKKDSSKLILDGINNIWDHLEEIDTISLKIESKEKEKLNDDLSNLSLAKFWSYEKLRGLEIFLNNCDFDEPFLQKLFDGKISHISQLRNITLQFDNTKITDHTAKSLSEALQNVLGKVESLKLSLSHTRITDIGFNNFWVSMENLKTLELNFDNTGITDETVELLIKKSLKTMKHLEIFRINLNNLQITNKSIIQLFSNLNCLKNFTFSVAHTKVSTKSVKIFLKQALPLLSQLEEVMFNLANTEVKEAKLLGILADIENLPSFRFILDYQEINNQNLETFINKNKKSSGLMTKFKHKFF